MSDISVLAKAVIDTCFYMDYYEYRSRPYMKFCSHCSGNVEDGEAFTDSQHSDNCPVLIAKRVLNE